METIEKKNLAYVHLRRMEPPGRLHTYRSFAEADEHLRRKSQTLPPNSFLIYSYEIAWEGDCSLNGELSIDSSIQQDACIVQEFVNLTLASNLLLYKLSPSKDDLRKTVLHLQWQMERLMQDPKVKEDALAIATSCKGVDEEAILSSYDMLREMVGNVDMFLPSLKTVFPNAQQKLENIRHLKNRSQRYIGEAVSIFHDLASDALYAALNNEQKLFQKKWNKIVKFCVEIFRDQKYADERLTTLGRKLYHLGSMDASLIDEKLNGEIRPFPEEASQEFIHRDMQVKKAFYNSMMEDRKTDEMQIYLLVYADSYFRKEARQISSRYLLSVCTAGELLRNHAVSRDCLKSLILSYDPMAVHFPSYPEIVLDRLEKDSVSMTV